MTPPLSLHFIRCLVQSDSWYALIFSDYNMTARDPSTFGTSYSWQVREI